MHLYLRKFRKIAPALKNLHQNFNFLSGVETLQKRPNRRINSASAREGKSNRIATPFRGCVKIKFFNVKMLS